MVRAPFELVDALVGGLFSKRRAASDEAEAEEIVEETLEEKERQPGSFLGKISAAVDRQLSTFGKDYVLRLVAIFEMELKKA